MSSEQIVPRLDQSEESRALGTSASVERWRAGLIGLGVSFGLSTLVGCLDDPAVDELPPYAEEYSEDGGMYRPVEPSSGSGYGSGYGSGSGAQPAASGAQPAASGAQREERERSDDEADQRQDTQESDERTRDNYARDESALIDFEDAEDHRSWRDISLVEASSLEEWTADTPDDATEALPVMIERNARDERR